MAIILFTEYIQDLQHKNLLMDSLIEESMFFPIYYKNGETFKVKSFHRFSSLFFFPQKSYQVYVFSHR